MADDDRHSVAYTQSPPSAMATSWMPNANAHIYPASHHGTPAQEYTGFTFAAPPASHLRMEPSAFSSGGLQHRPMHQQLQPLITMQQQPMPQWPSMLSSQQPPAFQQPLYSTNVQPVQPIGMGTLPTPVSATSIRSVSTPRKTLTDADRKRMCQYHDEHPNSKQTEIGAIFGVERSTVSKVLRQREKYLQQDDGSRSPIKRAKGRSPDVEKALSVWAKNQEKKGAPLSDELIREKARAFAVTASAPDTHGALSSSWLEKFKLKHNLMGARARKTSLALDDADCVSAVLSSSQTPQTSSPISNGIGTPSPPDLRGKPSQSSLKNESPDGLFESFQHRQDHYHTQSTTSLSSTFTDRAPSTFSPGPLSPTSPFFTPDSGTAPSPFLPSHHSSQMPHMPSAHFASQGMSGLAGTNAIRPRSQTFPLLDQYMLQSDGEGIGHKYSGPVLDSPMEEATDPLIGLDNTLHGGNVHPDDRRHTVIPSSSMRPPPLPAHLMHQQQPHPAHDIKLEMDAFTVHGGPSPEEARHALGVVLAFFHQQPTGTLDLQDTLIIGKLMEKLGLQSRGSIGEETE